MATTININFISSDLAERIGDKVATPQTDGKRLTAAQRMLFINKALLGLFNQYWTGFNGDKRGFVNLFPELIGKMPLTVNRDMVEASAIVFPIANPYLDYYTLIDGITNDKKYITVLDRTLYSTLLSSKVSDYTPSATKLVAIEIGKQVELLPPASFDEDETITMMYIKQPINPLTGGLLTQDGDYDSPFYPTWNTAITDIAEKLFLTSSKGGA